MNRKLMLMTVASIEVLSAPALLFVFALLLQAAKRAHEHTKMKNFFIIIASIS